MRHAQRQGHHTLPRRRSRPVPVAGAGEKRIYGRRRRRIRRRGTSRRDRPTRGDARRLAAEPGGATSQRGVRAHRAPAPPRRGPQALPAAAAVDGTAGEGRGKARVARTRGRHGTRRRSPSPGPSHVGRGERT